MLPNVGQHTRNKPQTFKKVLSDSLLIHCLAAFLLQVFFMYQSLHDVSQIILGPNELQIGMVVTTNGTSGARGDFS